MTSKSNFFRANFEKNNPGEEPPKNFCKIWSKEEEKQLLQEVQQNFSHDEIASKHDRTTGAIRSRLFQLAVSMIKNNTPIETCAEITGLTQVAILEKIERDKKKEPKTSKKTEVSLNNGVTISVETYEIIKLQTDVKNIMEQLQEIQNTQKQILNILSCLEIA
jgi:hypothetical protein